MTEFDLTLIQPRISEFAQQGRSALLPALKTAQSIYGYLAEPVVEEVGRLLGVPLADIHGVIEFYTLLYPHPIGNSLVQICTNPPCSMMGGEDVLNAVCDHLQIKPGETTTDGAYTVEPTTCLGLCTEAPALLVGTHGMNEGKAIGEAQPDNAALLVRGQGSLPQTPIYGETRRLTANCSKGYTTSLAEYEAAGGYQGLRRALRMDPSEVITIVKDSGLVGRGGAAFPTGIKWESAAQAVGERKFVVCNADESEPGTFKDRVLLENDPHRTLEGLIIAGHAIGASKGYIYVRGEYLNAYQTLKKALDEARDQGYVGNDILSTGFDFEIELRSGAGAYICGEETALFESIEGKRGFPRIKPPFPTTYGLFGQPTAINNVETLCNVPFIIEHGSAEYRKFGTERSPGTKLFCLSGDIARPGLYEAPFGISLRNLIFDLGGGVRDGRQLQAILLGGAAGGFAKPDQLDVKMSFEGLSSAGLPLGSGVVMVINDRRDLRSILLGLSQFFAHESCGKCYPCQLGTQRQYEILQRVAKGETMPGDTERLSDVGWTMSDASICGLGQTAASAVLSAMRLWPELFQHNR
jgi:NADH-quinone oxidoreductase subunit F